MPRWFRSVKYLGKDGMLLTLLLMLVLAIAVLNFMLCKRQASLLEKNELTQVRYMELNSRIMLLNFRIKTAESAVRAYAITRDRSFVKQFDSILSSISVLGQQVFDTSRLSSISIDPLLLSEFERLVAGRVEFLRVLKEDCDSGQVAGSGLLIASDGSSGIDERIIRVNRQITTAVDQRISSSRLEADGIRRQNNLILLIIGGTIIAAVAIVFSFLVNASRKIRRLNATLNVSVEERTRQLQTVNSELEAFTYSVSHDLRAPLRAINSYAQILVEDYSDNLVEDGKRVLQNIRHNAIKMGNLIDELLAFSKIGRKDVKKVEVDLNTITAEVIKEVNEFVPNSALFIVDELPRAYSDYSLLRLVMFNLVANAVKYSSRTPVPQIEIRYRKIAGKNCILVRDNGAGFDMRYVHKLFGVFQRLHSEAEFEGNGVGLAIVQRVITKLGHEVWGEGKVGEGAAFYFTIQLINENE